MLKIIYTFIIGLLISFTAIGCAKSDSSQDNTAPTAPEVVISSIQLTYANGEVDANAPVGTKGSLHAVALFSDKSKQDITAQVVFTSSDSNIVEINGNAAKATNVGDVNITTVLDGIKSNKVTATITTATLESITVSPADVSLPKGLTQQYIATGHYSDGTSSTDVIVSWKSSNDNTTINDKGLLTAVGIGKSTVTASQESISGNANLTISDAVLQTITVTPSQESIPNGESQKYDAIGTYSSGNSINITKSVTWSSSDEAIAKMDDFTARTIAVGNTVVTATLNKIVSNEAKLQVTDATLVSLEIQRAGPSLASESSEKFVVGTSIQSKAIGTYSDGSTRDVTDIVTWGTQTTDTVAVSQEGLISALKAGTANTYVAYQGIEDSDLISDIVEGEVHEASVTSLSVTGPQDAALGITIKLTAIAGYDNEDSIDVTEQATWSSSNPNINVLNGKVTASKVGDANITVTFDNNSSSVHSVRFTDATFTKLEIQDNYCEGGNCPVITGKTVEIELVDDVSYPNDEPDGLSPNAYYPTVWAVYSDGSKEYINDKVQTIWWSEDQNAAYVNYIKGSFIFGKDINPKVEIKATYRGKSAVFYVNVVAQTGKTLDEIVIKNGWDETLPDITEATVTVGEETPLVAYGWFTTADGNRTLEYINANVIWKSSDLQVAFINGASSSYVKGVSKGIADITALWQGKYAIVKMTVVADTSPTLISIFFEKGCGSTQTGETIDSANPLLLSVGQEQCINAWGKYSDGSVHRVTTTVFWTADDRSIASMDIAQRDSKVTGVALGETFVSATQDGVTGNAPVEVVALDSVSIQGTNETPIATSQQLEAIVHLSNGNTYNVNDKVQWTSSDENISTIDSNGLVSAISIGNVIFTATGKNDNTKTATHSMKIVDAKLVSIQIEKGYNPNTPQPISTLNVEVGTEEYITTWGIYADGSRRYVNTDTVYWSSDQQVASINYLSSSNIYGKDTGIATVTAQYGGKEATLAVTVISTAPKLVSIEITDGWGGPDITKGYLDLEVEQSKPVVAYGHYDDGSRVDINSKVFWTSEDTKIATIYQTQNSNVNGISEGSSKITAEWQGITAFVTARVSPSSSHEIKKIEIQLGYSDGGNGTIVDENNPILLTVGQVQYITAWGIYDNGEKEYINTEALWTSQNQKIASMPLAQTSSEVTGESTGDTTVTARYNGLSAIASVKVTTK